MYVLYIWQFWQQEVLGLQQWADEEEDIIWNQGRPRLGGLYSLWYWACLMRISKELSGFRH